MPAKRTTKTPAQKKAQKKAANKLYLERKKAKAHEAALDVSQPPAAEPPRLPQATPEGCVPTTPSEVFLDGDDFNEFAPDQGMGEDPIDQETGEFRGVLVTDEPINTGDGSSWVNAEKEDEERLTFSMEVMEEELRKQQEGQPLPAPVAVETPQATPGHIVAKELPDALETPPDSLVVERLINAINHLYAIARLTKGLKGPQPADVAKIVTNIKHARTLITRLK
jgi:hypothetical protein